MGLLQLIADRLHAEPAVPAGRSPGVVVKALAHHAIDGAQLACRRALAVVDSRRDSTHQRSELTQCRQATFQSGVGDAALLDEARRLGDQLRAPRRRRAGPFGLQIFGRRERKG